MAVKKKIKKRNVNFRENPVDVTLKAPGFNIGKGYAIEYEKDGQIFRHRLNSSDIIAGKGFVLLNHKSLKLTASGITGG